MSQEVEEQVEEQEVIEAVEEVEPELDEEGTPVEVEEEVPLFMQDDEEEEDAGELTPKKTVPEGVFLGAKKELKAANLRIAELEKKAGAQQPVQERLKRPLRDDFDSDEEYHTAADKYDDAKDKQRQASRMQQRQIEEHGQRLEAAVETFMGRADKLVAKHKIDPQAYADAVGSVKTVVETAFPNMGEQAYPQFLSHLEADDEATMFTIGKSSRQKEILAQKFREDPSGFKALRHIARLTERNMGTKPKQTKAPKPAAVATGGETSPVKEGAWKKKYDAAHKAGGGQKALDIKWAAQAAGVKTSTW